LGDHLPATLELTLHGPEQRQCPEHPDIADAQFFSRPEKLFAPGDSRGDRCRAGEDRFSAWPRTASPATTSPVSSPNRGDSLALLDMKVIVRRAHRACAWWMAHWGKVLGGAGVAPYVSKSSSRRFPVTVTHLPVTRCQICQQTVAYRPGSLSEVLTGHYRRAHPEALGLPAR